MGVCKSKEAVLQVVGSSSQLVRRDTQELRVQGYDAGGKLPFDADRRRPRPPRIRIEKRVSQSPLAIRRCVSQSPASAIRRVSFVSDTVGEETKEDPGLSGKTVEFSYEALSPVFSPPPTPVRSCIGERDEALLGMGCLLPTGDGEVEHEEGEKRDGLSDEGSDEGAFEFDADSSDTCDSLTAYLGCVMIDPYGGATTGAAKDAAATLLREA